MTHMASITLGEEAARRLTTAIGEHPLLGEQTIDMSEVAPGRGRSSSISPTRRTPRNARRSPGPAVSGIAELPETDWVAKSLAGLKPVRAGRFLVHGGHDRAAVKPNDISIEIEAGEAFGTGHHGTTAGCLAAIADLAKARPIRNALDVGTGSGVLAIAIARLTKARVLASDIDPVATRVAAANVRLNGVAARVRPITAQGLSGRLFRERAPYDLIVANILAGPLAALAPAISRACRAGRHDHSLRPVAGAADTDCRHVSRQRTGTQAFTSPRRLAHADPDATPERERAAPAAPPFPVNSLVRTGLQGKRSPPGAFQRVAVATERRKRRIVDAEEAGVDRTAGLALAGGQQTRHRSPQDTPGRRCAGLNIAEYRRRHGWLLLTKDGLPRLRDRVFRTRIMLPARAT